jgi:hypothetical protein
MTPNTSEEKNPAIDIRSEQAENLRKAIGDELYEHLETLEDQE